MSRTSRLGSIAVLSLLFLPLLVLSGSAGAQRVPTSLGRTDQTGLGKQILSRAAQLLGWKETVEPHGGGGWTNVGSFAVLHKSESWNYILTSLEVESEAYLAKITNSLDKDPYARRFAFHGLIAHKYTDSCKVNFAMDRYYFGVNAFNDNVVDCRSGADPVRIAEVLYKSASSLLGGTSPTKPTKPTKPSTPTKPGVDGRGWGATAHRWYQKYGKRLTFSCPAPGNARPLWGTGVYTADSSVCTAAVHAGRITVRAGGTVKIQITKGRSKYLASTRFGIHSGRWGKFHTSFVFV